MSSSPTLSEMEFPSSPQPSATITPSSNKPSGNFSSNPKKEKEKNLVNKLCRFLPPKKDEAFIGPILPTVEETITQIRQQCPTLSHIPSESISLKIRFDGKNSQACENVLFKIPSGIKGCWPNAISDKLHLIFIDVATTTDATKSTLPVISTDQAIQTDLKVQAERFAQAITYSGAIPTSTPPKEGEKELTWDDLKKDGALLGVQGWTDRPKAKF
ncbi:hypothetical protein L486_07923 [Kwoniella mangroviensis CBS 10435]|uniref:Uncharacterized protein n=1 Tax=Kwoniella mangroviensis CBS 10435 TaxID=1331196 RepID=A0A1B9IH78_9TREE|nr:uncharacterized protein I203_06809 [Kwoniella mangroviensis CBS 8507]OCF54787.1 hypothetical protein L486_07923 [Kwoniella mangroviensis CBS 10435]OCF64225.1 hypothetical protein I203_06809 [Kwoniella mangroviensis CBS 8507]OCF78579.1 hypothetical protein I204_00519 [Kwoniella mangroviensis CBS 8886]